MSDRAGPVSAVIDLLLCCARARVDPQTAGRIRGLVSGPLNWVEFLRLARHHGILALVCSGLQNVCPDAVPPAIGDQLSRYVRRCAERNRRLAGELLDLLALLDAHAIAALPLKGPVLAAAVYGDLSHRECVDLDILIRRQDMLQAKDLFLSAGYELRTKLNARGFPSKSGEYEYAFAHTGARLAAELCWRITPEGFLGSLDLDYLGERRQPVRLAGTLVAHLPPEEHLLALCVHGGKHCWASLKWICDVAELVRAFPNLDWGRLRALATPLGCWRAVALGLLLAHDLVDAPLPEAVLSETRRETGARRLAAWVQTWLFGDGNDAPMDTPSPWSTELGMEWERRRYLLRLVERVPDKLWNCLLTFRLLRPCVRLLVPTEKDRRLLPLPAPLTFLYYPLRPARVAVQCGVRPVAKHLAAAVRRIRLPTVRPG